MLLKAYLVLIFKIVFILQRHKNLTFLFSFLDDKLCSVQILPYRSSIHRLPFPFPSRISSSFPVSLCILPSADLLLLRVVPQFPCPVFAFVCREDRISSDRLSWVGCFHPNEAHIFPDFSPVSQIFLLSNHKIFP